MGADIRDHLNTAFIQTLSSAEQQALVRMRAFDLATGVSLNNEIPDEINGDIAFIPSQSQIFGWRNSFTNINAQYGATFWVRDPDLSPYEGYVISSASALLRVFVTSFFAARPAIVLDMADVAAIFPVIAEATGKPWAIEADSSLYPAAPQRHDLRSRLAGTSGAQLDRRADRRPDCRRLAGDRSSGPVAE
jgi:hypothetical protein